MIDKSYDVPKWEADARPLLSTKEVKNQLSKIGQDDVKLKNPFLEARLIVIPGLRGAWSIDSKTKKASFGNDWVPQGVTQSSTDYFISMYDGDYKLNSVIFQVNKKTGHYVKTLILNSKSHVGGIYFDEEYKHLFWSDDRKLGGGISYVTQEQISHYQAREQRQPINSIRINWELSSHTSAITFYNHQIIVAKYGKNKNDREIIASPLDKKGIPYPITYQEILERTNISNPMIKKRETFEKIVPFLIEKQIINSYHQGWDRLQGIAIGKAGFTLLSQSNGEGFGKIWAQKASGDVWSKLKYTAPKHGARVINVPKSVEEVSLDDKFKTLTLIFESGAKKYREQDTIIEHRNFMDRLVVIPTNILGMQ